MQASLPASLRYANWELASEDSPMHRAEFMITQEPETLSVERYHMQGKLPLGRQLVPVPTEVNWNFDREGKVTGLFHRYFSYVWPFWQTVTTEIAPREEALFDNAECEDATDAERARLLYSKDKEDAIALVASRSINHVRMEAAFSLANEDGNFYIYNPHARTRSRAIPEDKLIEAVCGSPQPHIGVATYHLDGIYDNGAPSLKIALKEKGQNCDHIHRNILFGAIARLFGFDDRDRLVAAGEVKEKDGELATKLVVPKARIITAKRIDVAISTIFGASMFGALIATYRTNPGPISIATGIASCHFLFQAYSRYHKKD